MLYDKVNEKYEDEKISSLSVDLFEKLAVNEIEDAKKRLNILEKEIQRAKKLNNNNNNINNKTNTNRGKSVGIKRINHNNINNNFNNNNNFGGMFGDSDPFNDSFFKFPNFNNEGKSDDSIIAEQMGLGFI